MSIDITEYNQCWRCGYQRIGRYWETEFLYERNGVAVFRDYTTLVCLQCGTVQSQTNSLREVRLG